MKKTCTGWATDSLVRLSSSEIEATCPFAAAHFIIARHLRL
jgi:hypothetical protein